MLNGKKHYLLALALIGAVSLTGCGGGGGGGSSSTSTTPTTGTVQFVNSGSLYSIDELYLSLSSSTSWGVKQNSSAIAPGVTFNLNSVPVGTYDAKAVSLGTTSTYYMYKYAFGVTAGSTYTLTNTDSSWSGTLIINNTNAVNSITAVYVSTTALGSGANQISSSVAPGTSRQIVAVPAGTYFVRVVQGGVNRDNTGVGVASHSFTTMTYN